MSEERCLICGQRRDEQDEVWRGDGAFYHEECCYQADTPPEEEASRAE